MNIHFDQFGVWVEAVLSVGSSPWSARDPLRTGRSMIDLSVLFRLRVDPPAKLIKQAQARANPCHEEPRQSIFSPLCLISPSNCSYLLIFQYQPLT